MGLLDRRRYKYNCSSRWTTESQVGTFSYYSSFSLDLYSAQSLSVYCGQLITLGVFAWVILVLVTFAIFVVHTRDILASSRGDGAREPQIA
ncbi:uncharacterized protein BJ212DRAFT_193225 [Suillus subaureus]|uniref:Uncharacterized protein n=1 Tax=Suillus subaureus TaxID=48587 RepID=A0A9P7JDT7_9AGAM|nr:uncharacterized protein BJ212DRAFT_193225 [Suillus subaureus]KAG1816491.1 hypothetical protein BJ212DRAFT_193225 [Suillus subaureus]